MSVFEPELLGVLRYIMSNDPGMGPYRHRGAASIFSISQSGIILLWWGFPKARGGVESGDRPFSSRYVEIVEVCRDLVSGDGPYHPRVWRNLDGLIQYHSSRYCQRPLAWV